LFSEGGEKKKIGGDRDIVRKGKPQPKVCQSEDGKEQIRNPRGGNSLSKGSATGYESRKGTGPT